VAPLNVQVLHSLNWYGKDSYATTVTKLFVKNNDFVFGVYIQPHSTYLSTLKICRVELCTELLYAIIPTLFLCFLLICYPYTSCYIFNVFYSCSCHFFSSRCRCLSWSLPSITEQQVSPHRLPTQYWLKNHWPDQAFFKHSTDTNNISNSAILRNN